MNVRVEVEVQPKGTKTASRQARKKGALSSKRTLSREMMVKTQHQHHCESEQACRPLEQVDRYWTRTHRGQKPLYEMNQSINRCYLLLLLLVEMDCWDSTQGKNSRSESRTEEERVSKCSWHGRAHAKTAWKDSHAPPPFLPTAV